MDPPSSAFQAAEVLTSRSSPRVPVTSDGLREAERGGVDGESMSSAIALLAWSALRHVQRLSNFPTQDWHERAGLEIAVTTTMHDATGRQVPSEFTLASCEWLSSQSSIQLLITMLAGSVVRTG